jgi:hypothetical protein
VAAADRARLDGSSPVLVHPTGTRTRGESSSGAAAGGEEMDAVSVQMVAALRSEVQSMRA